LGLPGTAKCYASSINPDDLSTKMASHSEMGQSFFKLKLGFGDEADFDFVRNAHDLVPPGGALMVDSNQKWTPDQAEDMFRRLQIFGLRFAEEPIPANAPLSDWARLARTSEVPLAAGENLYGINTFRAFAEAGVTVLQPDVAKWGGVSGALDLASALPREVQIWPHFMGTAVGQIAALSVAAAVGPGSICEMDVNINGLRSDLCGDALLVRDGEISLPTEPGLVVPPSPDMLAKFGETAP